MKVIKVKQVKWMKVKGDQMWMKRILMRDIGLGLTGKRGYR